MGKGAGWTVSSSRPLGTAALEVTPDRQAANSRRAVPCAVLGREAVVLSWCSVQRGQSGSSASTRPTFEIAMR
jgi:hypothetical protein